MPTERKKARCRVWGDKFWNDFFHPRHPGVFLILLDIVVTIAYTCCYILLAIYFGAFSNDHADGYLIIFLSNVTVIIVGFFVIHFLTMRPDDLTILRCATLYFGQLLAAVFGLTAIIKFNATPTNDDIMKYVTHFFHEYHRVPRILERLQQEKKCCGVYGIEDFVNTKGLSKTKRDQLNITRLPDSCCVKWFRYCGDFKEINESLTYSELKSTPKFYQNACFGKSRGFSSLAEMSPGTYRSLQWIHGFSYFNLFLVLLIFLVYCYYVCYKLPKEDDRPHWGEDNFLEKCLVTPFKCFSQPKIIHSLDGINDGDMTEFQKRHNGIGASITRMHEGVPETGSESGSVDLESPGSPRASGSAEMDINSRRPIQMSSSTDINPISKAKAIVTDPRASYDNAQTTGLIQEHIRHSAAAAVAASSAKNHKIIDEMKAKKKSAVPADIEKSVDDAAQQNKNSGKVWFSFLR